ncbi:hypothetical protein Tco_0090848 [Tanacetum coccineum]
MLALWISFLEYLTGDNVMTFAIFLRAISNTVSHGLFDIPFSYVIWVNAYRCTCTIDQMDPHIVKDDDSAALCGLLSLESEQLLRCIEQPELVLVVAGRGTKIFFYEYLNFGNISVQDHFWQGCSSTSTSLFFIADYALDTGRDPMNILCIPLVIRFVLTLALVGLLGQNFSSLEFLKGLILNIPGAITLSLSTTFDSLVVGTEFKESKFLKNLDVQIEMHLVVLQQTCFLKIAKTVSSRLIDLKI